MEIIETRSADVVTLALNGRLDGSTYLGFEGKVFRHIEAGLHRMIIDMAHLDFIDSHGLRVLMAAAKQLTPVGGRMVLCAPQPSIRRVLDIAGFSTIFTIVATPEEAAALFAPSAAMPRTGHMDMTETRSAGVVTLALNGRLDGTSSGVLETRMLALLDGGDRRFIIDMAELDFMSSVGLRAFVVIAKGLHAVDGRLVLCAVQPPIKQLFDLTGFWASFTMAATPEEALTILAS